MLALKDVFAMLFVTRDKVAILFMSFYRATGTGWTRPPLNVEVPNDRLSSLFFLRASLTFSMLISELQSGHLWFASVIFARNQPSIHFVWKTWRQIGSLRTGYPLLNSSKQITQSGCLKSSILLSYGFSLMRQINCSTLCSLVISTACTWFLCCLTITNC